MPYACGDHLSHPYNFLRRKSLVKTMFNSLVNPEWVNSMALFSQVIQFSLKKYIVCMYKINKNIIFLYFLKKQRNYNLYILKLLGFV